jgi:TonB family protein
MTPMTNLVRRPVTAGPALMLAAVLSSPLAHAQAPAASAAQGVEQGISERARKDAAGPLYWIRLNAQSTSAAAAKAAPRKATDRPAAAMAGPAAQRPPGTGAGGPAKAAASSAGETTTGIVGPAPEVAAELGPPGTFAATAPPLTDEANDPLTLISGAEPEFPPGVIRRLRKGAVQVTFDVQPDGSVQNAAVVQTPNDKLNAPALKAVSGWRFKPAGTVRSAVVDLGFDLDD